jgi:hypothetical protein
MFISLGKSCFFIPPTFFNCFNLFIKNVLMLHRYNRGKSWLHSYINFFSICFVKKRLKKDMEKRSWKFWGNIICFFFWRKGVYTIYRKMTGRQKKIYIYCKRFRTERLLALFHCRKWLPFIRRGPSRSKSLLPVKEVRIYLTPLFLRN